jgi:hypothetical protein
MSGLRDILGIQGIRLDRGKVASGGSSIPNLFLNLYPGALLCWSLLLRNKTYTGPILTVLRDSDDVEQDFYAVYNSTYGIWMVDLAAILTFCGASIGYASKEWDQTGNGHHRFQTIKLRCPKICESGAIKTKNGFPALDFDGTSDIMQTASGIIGNAADWSIFLVGAWKEIGQANDFYIGSSNGAYGGTDQWIVFRQLSGNTTFRITGPSLNRTVTNGVSDTNQKLGYLNYKASTRMVVGINNTLVTDTTSIPAAPNLSAEIDFGAGDNGGTPVAFGAIYDQEIIIYLADKSGDQAAMRADINASYGIY